MYGNGQRKLELSWSMEIENDRHPVCDETKTQDTRTHPTRKFENNWQTQYILTREIQEEAVTRG